MQQQTGPEKGQRIYTAAEVAQYEYCSLLWWHEQFDPLAKGETEELFAKMVEMEYQHGPQATSLPDYQVIEQVLAQRGAFERADNAAEEGSENRNNADEQIEEEELPETEEAEEIGISQKMIRLRALAFASLGGGIVLVLLSIASGFLFSR